MKPICVFGILDTTTGREIAREMLAWLHLYYDVRQVRHDGTQFEYPALALAKQLSEETGEPVLYIHTRGAVNTYPTTKPCRRCWREEFGTQWAKYFALARTEKPMVLCPFVDYDKETRYNGFVANAAAWRAIDLQPSRDRFDFERLWIKKDDVQVLGLLIHSDKHDIKKIRAYLLKNYSE